MGDSPQGALTLRLHPAHDRAAHKEKEGEHVKEVDRIKFNPRTGELWINGAKVHLVSEDGFDISGLNKNDAHSVTVKILLPDIQITTE